MADKSVLYAIASVIGLVSVIAYSAFSETLSSDASDARDAEPTEFIADADAPSVPLDEQVVGSWVQAESGGEDGLTKCADAEVMTTLNGGSTEDMRFLRNGSIEYTLWYDTAYERKGEPEVKAAYNQGNWKVSGSQLHISWQGGKAGLFGSDLGAGEVDYNLAISGNVMSLASDERKIRYVRCQPE